MPTFPDPRCCGPFVRGVPGSDDFGGCFGQCCPDICPPPDCCGSACAFFDCGTSATPEFPEGCDFGAPFMEPMAMEEELDAPNPLAEVELPFFSKEAVSEDSDFVFSLSTGCSIPCTEVKVTLTVVDEPGGMCCLDIDGSSVFAVGDGCVSFEAVPAFTLECGAFEITVNGSTISPVCVSDGDLLTITVKSSLIHDCCPCELTRVENPCNMAPLWFKKDGKKYLHKTNLIKKVNILRKKKIRNRLRKSLRRPRS